METQVNDPFRYCNPEPDPEDAPGVVLLDWINYLRHAMGLAPLAAKDLEEMARSLDKLPPDVVSSREQKSHEAEQMTDTDGE